MPLANYLVRNASGSINKGDVVFHIADSEEGLWRRKPIAHVGIANEDRQHHRRDDPLRVIHMTLKRVDEHIWNTGEPAMPCVDLVGSITTLGKTKRAKIIDKAVTLSLSKPSIIQRGLSPESCTCFAYYAGDPSLTGHPAYPNMRGLYAFTCATFVNECFKQARVTLLVTTNMPIISASDRQELQKLLEPRGLAAHIQDTPFKRIFPSYLAHAFHRDQYPLDLPNWESFQHHGYFIPVPEHADIAPGAMPSAVVLTLAAPKRAN